MNDRDHIEMWGINSRIPIQAVIASRVLKTEDKSNDRRIEKDLDNGLMELDDFVKIPKRNEKFKDVYQLT